MKQEPYGWANLIDDELIEGEKKHWMSDNWIPLYTEPSVAEPQYRELSDEEIQEIANLYYLQNFSMKDFARAILRKAQEK